MRRTFWVLTLSLLTGCLRPAICLQLGKSYEVSFSDRWGPRHERLIAGEHWGPLDRNGGVYDCMGRCGTGCAKSGSQNGMWLEDCLRHDVCSYRHASQDHFRDPDCGDEMRDAALSMASYLIFGCSDEATIETEPL